MEDGEKSLSLIHILSMDEFLNITGVGEKKAARYGMAFLRAIEDMVGSRE